ncbi:DHA2 family efflux MFS transporter permease subunit [Allokutzneria oryzae]|uniref:DHA2 family efflux MFS transporter permease subunit n=1 Tax=Allokutzneria oryzae TaxID=1378989 RepID=A0ABV5ZPF3_9PSEU
MNTRAAVAVVYVLAMFMNGLDTTIVNPALLTIGQGFGISPAETNLVEAGYLVSLAVVLPVAGWLGDRFGTKLVFLGALSVFTAASVLCGLSESIGALVFFRVLQGLGGGLLTPVGMTMLFRAFPPEQRMRISKYLMIPTALAPALGPVLGGLLTEHLSWRWAFYVNLPVGLITVLIGLLFLREHVEPGTGRFDLRGFLLVAPGSGALMFALGEAPGRGWGSPTVLGLGIAGVVLLVLFVRAQLRTEEPLLDLRLLADKAFGSGSSIMALASAGLLGMLFVFPLMFQDALGASALSAGLVVFPEAIGLLAASQLVDLTCKRLGPQRVVFAGLLAGAVLFALLGVTTEPWSVRVLMFGVGFFLGHAVMAVQVASFDTIDPPSMGRAMSLFQVIRMLGGSIGVAALAGVIGGGGVAAPLFSYQLAMFGSALFLVAAALVSMVLRRKVVSVG